MSIFFTPAYCERSITSCPLNTLIFIRKSQQTEENWVVLSHYDTNIEQKMRIYVYRAIFLTKMSSKVSYKK